MRKIVLLTGLFMVMAAGAFAIDQDLLTGQDFISPTSYDARARAMGHTNILMATGANSIFYNPANLALMTDKSFEAGFRMHLFGSFKDEGMEEPGVSISSKFKMHPKFTDLSFGMPIPMSSPDLKLAVGLGYNTYFDWARTMKIEVTADGVTGTHESKLHGGLATLTPALALGYQDKYFFGLALSKSIMSNVSLDEERAYDPDPAQLGWTEENDAKLSATFFTVGATAKPTPELALGATFRTGFTEKLTDIEWVYSGADGTNENGKEGDIEAKQKAILGFGASYQLSPMVLVSAEFQTRKFLDITMEQLPSPDNPGGESEFDTTTTIKNGSCFKLGIEYKTGNIPIRLGFFSEAIGVRDELGDNWWEKAEKPKSLSGFTGGFGLVKNNLALDFFAEYAFWSMKYDETVDATLTTFKYSEKLFTLGLGISYNLK